MRIRGYRFCGTLHDNPFESDEMIFDLEHYLRMRDFEEIGKKILSDVGTFAESTPALECEGKQKWQKVKISSFYHT